MKYIKLFEYERHTPALILAIKQANFAFEDFKKLIETEDIEQKDAMEWTPLLWATYYRRQNTIKFLIDSGADVQYKALHHINGSKRMVDFYDLAVDKDYKKLQRWIEKEYPEIVAAKKYNI